jgi:hypothetical protein
LALITAQRTADARRTDGALVWQRTGTVGTELVLGHGTVPGVVTGVAVVGGTLPYSARWHADLDAEHRVRALTITCEGAGWRRNLALATAGDQGWTCGAEETGELEGPGAGVGEPRRLDGVALPLLADSPTFLTWAMRLLGLGASAAPAKVPVARVRLPWLAVVPTMATFHRVSAGRLRVTGDGPAATYDLDADGIVTYQPGRWRISQ